MPEPKNSSTTHRVRAISTLTEEQVQRKRDTDRKAQRALRQRTNARIQALEEQLAALKAERSQADDAAGAKINALRQINEDLRRRLRNVDAVIRDIAVSEVGSDEGLRSYASACHFPAPLSPNTEHSVSVEEASPTHVRTEDRYQNLSQETRPYLSDNEVRYSMPPLERESCEAMVGLSPPASWSFLNHPEAAIEKDKYLDGTAHGKEALSPRSTGAVSVPRTISDYMPVAQPIIDSQIAIWNILPKHLPATCPLDHILLNFLSSSMLLVAGGESTATVVGPPTPAISGLLNPDQITRHPTSRVMVDVVSTFEDTNIQEKLGFLYIMYATMRWQIASTQESFERMPSWLRPTILQIAAPHAAWIDNIPWPRVRDLLIQNPVKYPFQEFSELYSRSVKLTWPHEPLDAVIQSSVDEKEFTMNPLFEKHIRRLESWTVGDPFKGHYPEMMAAMQDRQD